MLQITKKKHCAYERYGINRLLMTLKSCINHFILLDTIVSFIESKKSENGYISSITFSYQI